MTDRLQGQIPAARRKLIERIAARAKHKRVGAIDARNFIAAYYRGVSEDDLRARKLDDLAGAALAHLRFAGMRKRGRPIVRVYSPEKKRDGFASSHTIVEASCEDMPFLVDSLAIVFAELGIAVHLTVHPILRVKRNRGGALTALLDVNSDTGGLLESWQQIEIDRLPDEQSCERLSERLLATLLDVQLACDDWRAMLDRAKLLAQELRRSRPARAIGNPDECAALLDWLADNHFTFLGYREFKLQRGATGDTLEPITDTSLGILRRRTGKAHVVELTGALREQARAPELLFVTKANTRSTVHRGVYLDYIGVKRFDRKGNVVGERRFLGLFTSSAYQARPRDIPLLREKIDLLNKRFGLAPNSHDGKAVAHVIETYPRDELFQSSIGDLMEAVRGIVNLYERRQVRLFVRVDRFQRYYACLVFVPRDRYSTQVRERIEAVMLDAMHGTAVESQIQMSDSALARVHLVVRAAIAEHKPLDVDQLEARIAATVRTWSDRLRDALVAKHGEPAGLALARRFANAFPAAYQADVAIDDVLEDIDQLVPLLDQRGELELRLQTRADAPWHLRLLRVGGPVALSDALPLLENLGLRVLTERPYCIACDEKRETWVQDFELEIGSTFEQSSLPLRERVRERGVSAERTRELSPSPQPSPLKGEGASEIDRRFRSAYLAVDAGRAESDGFNRLVLAAGLEWRQVTVLRAYARYLLQTGLPFSQSYMEKTLTTHPAIAAELWMLFAARSDPEADNARRASVVKNIEQRIVRQLDAVASQDEDRILRAYLAAISATLRTNYYQRADNATHKQYLSLKLDSQRIPNLPLPRPDVEVFVYSPRVEGIHLRMGKVARGGIRWSDRREDFRTEVLGLMKAQNVKNAVIVPVGAKGGFVPKRLTPTMTGDDRQREGVECYRTFIRGLLDITDNTVGGKILPPARVVRHDGYDPYLVVAADKGTASFSDVANAISVEYNFWLGDAFASGGSAGYDHKKMAITARGAWESVKRHFRELGLDTQTQDFTVVGIGDMSGDVFGNGMLCSKHIRLLAAFDHRHIFIDPDPDAGASYAERERLFKLPRSSWQDYDAKLISAGGGVFPRSAKSIKLTPQVKSMLGVSDDTLTPQELIRSILYAPVDLLWNGGIGTYVKASDESHAQVGDRANDSVRADGKALRCKVIGEGGNLGLTQLGRVEYAQQGGRINTDFIDNSGGVDCSDHEVNIKILLNASLGKSLTLAERNRLLARMTEDVAALVLRDNYLQGQALSMIELTAKQRLPEHMHLIRSLELSAELDRAVEFLPSAESLEERLKLGQSLTRPELAVLLCYSKLGLFNRLVATDVPEDPYLSRELARYFPGLLQTRYRAAMRKHRLRREIIATAITNSLVNRMGPTFARRAQEDTAADAAAVARAYTIAREIFEARELWSAIEGLDNRVPAATQYDLMNEIARLLRFSTYWLINRHRADLHIERNVAALRPGIRELRRDLQSVLSGELLDDYGAQRERIVAQRIPSKLADQLASIEALYAAPDIVELASAAKRSVIDVASAYFRLDTILSINWLRDSIQALPVQDRWQAVARSTLRDNLYGLHRQLCLQVLARTTKKTPDDIVANWQKSNVTTIRHIVDSIKDMRALPKTNFAILSVGMQLLRQLLD